MHEDDECIGVTLLFMHCGTQIRFYSECVELLVGSRIYTTVDTGQSNSFEIMVPFPEL